MADFNETHRVDVTSQGILRTAVENLIAAMERHEENQGVAEFVLGDRRYTIGLLVESKPL